MVICKVQDAESRYPLFVCQIANLKKLEELKIKKRLKK